MNFHITINDNHGIIYYKKDYKQFIGKSRLFLESAYLYNSNLIAINHPVYVYFDFDTETANFGTQSYSICFYPNQTASNVLKIENRQFLGTKNEGFQKQIEYDVFDWTFTPLTGNILLVCKFSIE